MLKTCRHVPSGATGVTLIELMIGVAIITLLVLMAAPSYTQWIANTRVRATTEAIQNGLMLAKGEALKRNAKVQFVLTSDDPVVANVDSLTASTSGAAWMVRIFQAGGTYTDADFIQGRSAAEGGANTAVSAGQSTVVFTGMGGLSPVPAANIAIDVSGTGSNRALRTTIEKGGAIRMCDPALSVATSSVGC
jgi:type IV fimbrial biogenesis protein FimT